MNGIADRIRTARKQAGLGQGDVADAFGVTRSAVSQWETGLTVPEASKVARLADLCGVSIDWLFHGIDAPQPKSADQAPYALEALPDLLGKRQFAMLCEALGVDEAMAEARQVSGCRHDPGDFIARAIQRASEHRRATRSVQRESFLSSLLEETRQ